MTQRILIVGHCNIDGPRLKSEISAAMPEAEVERINSDADLKHACEQGAALLLVNREPVGFDATGVQLIVHTLKEYPDSRAMLVSDVATAQAEAEKAGALPGFGKRLMGSSKLTEHVAHALAS